MLSGFGIWHLYITKYLETLSDKAAFDLQFCQQYSSVKPAPAGIEFLELVYTYYCMKMAGIRQTIVKNHDH